VLFLFWMHSSFLSVKSFTYDLALTFAKLSLTLLLHLLPLLGSAQLGNPLLHSLAFRSHLGILSLLLLLPLRFLSERLIELFSRLLELGFRFGTEVNFVERVNQLEDGCDERHGRVRVGRIGKVQVEDDVFFTVRGLDGEIRTFSWLISNLTPGSIYLQKGNQ